MPPSGVSEPPSSYSAWLLAGLSSFLVFAAFVAYAFLAPATYRTSALVEVVRRPNATAPSVAPVQAARRIHEAVLDREALSKLSAQRAADADAQNQLASHLESALRIDSIDARTFVVSFRDSDRRRATSTCNWLAERVKERAPRVLAATGAPANASDRERRRRLAAFLATHPELAPDAKTLLAHKALLELLSSKEQLDSRAVAEHVAQLKTALDARIGELAKQRSDSAKAEAKALGELQRTLGEMVHANDAAAEPPFEARVATLATVPTWPIEPNRIRLLVSGFLCACATGAIAGLIGQRRRDYDETAAGSYPPDGSSSSPPPPGPEDAANIEGEEPITENTEGVPLQPWGPPSSRARVPRSAASVADAGVTQGADGATGPEPERGGLSEGDRITPVTSSVPPRPPSRGEPGLQAALEVNASVPVSSAPPASASSQGAASKATRVLGSPIPPIIPASARASLQDKGLDAAAGETGYRYVSTPPPGRRSERTGNGNDNASVVSRYPVQEGWRPDLSLLPESRRALCDELYPLAVISCSVVAVVGAPDVSEAKSRLAAELALALAESGHTRVLLLEGDLVQPRVRRFLKVQVPPGHGFSEQLGSRVNVPGARRWTVIECSQSLHALPEGRESNADLMLSHLFEECIRELRRDYDFIIIDGPSIGDKACRAVHDVVDCVLFSHGGSFRPSDLSEAKELFSDKKLLVVPSAS